MIDARELKASLEQLGLKPTDDEIFVIMSSVRVSSVRRQQPALPRPPLIPGGEGAGGKAGGPCFRSATLNLQPFSTHLTIHTAAGLALKHGCSPAGTRLSQAQQGSTLPCPAVGLGPQRRHRVHRVCSHH